MLEHLEIAIKQLDNDTYCSFLGSLWMKMNLLRYCQKFHEKKQVRYESRNFEDVEKGF